MIDTKLPVSVLVAVRNEEKNIRQCLASLRPALEVFVVDSMSSDKTAWIAEHEFDAQVIQFRYEGGYPKKRQWALDKLELRGDWVFLIDADEEVPTDLWKEIETTINNPRSRDAYLIRKGFHFLGRKFRFGGFSHSAVLLLRKGKGRFEALADAECGLDMEVHERIIVDGSVGSLKTPLIHEDFKGLDAYLDRHNKYSTWEAQVRNSFLARRSDRLSSIQPKIFGNAQERRRFLKHVVMRVPFEPTIWFVYHYFICLGFMEGKPGYVASRIRAAYIFQVRTKLYELRKVRLP